MQQSKNKRQEEINSYKEYVKKKNAETGKPTPRTLGVKEVRDVALNKDINTLVSKTTITLNDVKQIGLQGGAYVESDGENYYFSKTLGADKEGIRTEPLGTVPINDREALRNMLFRLSDVGQAQRTFGNISISENVNLGNKSGK